MKKLFLSLMLVAAFAMGFTSCSKDGSNNNDDQTTTHAQKFTLGETNYHVDNSTTIENIQYHGGDTYNAIVLSNGQIIGETGGEGHGIIILFNTDITAGTYEMSNNLTAFPKYLFANLTVEDIVNFNYDDLMAQDDVYQAVGGAFTLSMSGKKYTITTDNIEVVKVSDPEDNRDSSIDYEGTVSHYVLATVEEGNLNNGEEDAEIVTAGRMTYNLPIVGKKNIACFITASGDMIGFYYQGNEIPVGTQTNPTLIFVENMDIKNGMTTGLQGTINVEVADDVYTIDIIDSPIGHTMYNMHYVGTLPFVDFPF